MVFLILTRVGFEEIEPIFITNKSFSVWVNSKVISESKTSKLRASGVNITNFINLIDITDTDKINDAIDTIAEHHPGESIWVETHTKA